MRIGVLVGHPTQFEGPFYQYAARDEINSIDALFTESGSLDEAQDQELGLDINWGIDLLTGYRYQKFPTKNEISWLKSWLVGDRRMDFLISGS